MKHSKYMNLCYCAAGRAEPRGAKRAQLKNVAVAAEIVRSAKQSVKERARRVAAQITTTTTTTTNVAVAGEIVRSARLPFCQLLKTAPFKHNC